MGLRSGAPRRPWLIVALPVALLAGGTAAALALRSSEPAAASPLAHPRDVIRSIDAATLGQKSVRWTEKAGSNDPLGLRQWRSTSDVTADSGVQRITIPHFRGGTGRAEIRLVGNGVYVKGNAIALEWMALRVTQTQALRYAGRWISIPKWHDPLAEYSEHLTLAALVDDELQPASTLDGWTQLPDNVYLTATTKSDGTQVVEFEDDSGDLTHKIDLSAHTGGEPLPIASSELDAGYEGGFDERDWFSGRFSRWNEPVHVIAPKHAVPIATVRAS
jgi:hypothetical protein